MAETRNRFDLAEVRKKLAGKSGPEYWRSLEEVAETEEFQSWVEDEFPNRSSLLDVNRRDVIKFMGASMMLAGLAGCRSLVLPSEQVIPYVKRPEDIIPGKALQFATAMPHNQSAIGVLVTSYEGRPVKIEGNPGHAASKGATDYFTQAAILEMYDPDRSREVHKQKFPSTWDILSREAISAFTAAKASGKAIYIISETIQSPTIAAQLRRFVAKYPTTQVVQYDAVSPDNVLEGSRRVFGKPLYPVFDLSQADVVVSFDGDFLHSMPDSVRMSGEFAQKRGSKAMNRLYVVESSPTLAGAMADHRLPVKPSAVEATLAAVAAAMGIGAGGGAGVDAAFVAGLVKDLRAAKSGVVLAGASVSAYGHALVAKINAALGGQGVRYQAPLVSSESSQLAGLKKFAQDASAGKVGALVILGGDPVYNAPADLNLGEALKSFVPFSVHHSLYLNTTSAACTFQAAASHFLESWGDVRALDGSVTVQQPLIAPLFNTKSAAEMLAHITERPRTAHELVRETYSGVAKALWEKGLHDGVMVASSPPVTATPSGAVGAPAAAASGSVEIAFRPDPTIWDGRYVNNGWLQELPKPLTTVTWDTPALVSPRTAESLGIENGAHIKVTVGQGSIEVPALITVGHADDTVTLFVGGGQQECGTVGKGMGTDCGPVRQSGGFWSTGQGSVEKAAGSTALALTQTHHSMQGRDIVRAYTVAEVLAGNFAPKEEHEAPNMYPDADEEFPWDGAKWGMTIDLNLCSGCHACVSACQAENNIPVVGKDQVLRGREMHWMRIDRYYKVADKDPNDQLDPKNHKADVFDSSQVSTVLMPVACMHCELAPCEPVCPVAATVHSAEGINQMVYNRCVGTRYCSNNCPYKVRRFNYLNYTDNQPQFMERTEALNTVTSSEKASGRAMLKLLNNPNVTVRGRGVMEKCTYCIQRINAARIDSKREGRELKDGDVVTACQAACPMGAIKFGNIADPKSSVSASRQDPRNYILLEELNLRNRTTYLAKMRNPNPEMKQV